MDLCEITLDNFYTFYLIKTLYYPDQLTNYFS